MLRELKAGGVYRSEEGYARVEEKRRVKPLAMSASFYRVLL